MAATGVPFAEVACAWAANAVDTMLFVQQFDLPKFVQLKKDIFATADAMAYKDLVKALDIEYGVRVGFGTTAAMVLTRYKGCFDEKHAEQSLALALQLPEGQDGAVMQKLREQYQPQPIPGAN